MKREVRFVQGYNCIDFPCKMNKKCSPENSHGKHGMEIVFLVHGEKGCVQFVLSTGWTPFYSEKDRISHRNIPKNPMHPLFADLFPIPIDLGYHSYTPHYEGQTSMGGCKYLDGKDCFYDGSSLNCNDAYYTLINGGEEALWKFLEQYYACTFENGDYPNVCEYGKTV